MRTTYDTLEGFHHAGEYLQLIRAARQISHGLEQLDVPSKTLAAQALAASGSSGESKQLATAVVAANPSALVRSRAEVALGMAEEFEGDYRAAYRHYRIAIQAAQESRDSVQLAWSYLKLFRSLIDGHPMDGLRTTLSEVRAVVTAAGRPDVTAFLHTCVAALEGQTGRLDEAIRHCDIADSLSSIAPNSWVISTAVLNRACVMCLRWDLRTATKLFTTALDIAERSGHARNCDVANNNLGHVEALLGNWAAASRYLTRVMKSPTAVLAMVSASDTMAKISLARGDFDESRRSLRRLNDYAQKRPHLAATYNGRWSVTTAVRHLIRSERWSEALRLVLEVESRAATLGDKPLEATLHFLAGEILAKLNDRTASAERFVKSTQLGVTRYAELHPQFDFSAAAACGTTHPIGHQLRKRAQRIWKYHDIVLTPMELGATSPATGR